MAESESPISTSTNEKRKFIGQFSDDTGLSYLNARYYNPNQGQFISQDPVFWELGITQAGRTALTNPQALNSYSYANDNPITGKDPNGREAYTWNLLNMSAEEGFVVHGYPSSSACLSSPTKTAALAFGAGVADDRI